MNIKCAPLGDFEANFYLVCDNTSDDAFAVDPGADAQTAIELIKDSGKKLKYIIITHAHADHIGALDALKSEFDAKVVIGKFEEKALNDGKLNLCPAFGFDSPKTKADITVSDGDTLPFGKNGIKFIHTPGHTQGGICIITDDFLISGDTIFYMSVGRSDFPGGDFNALQESIKNKIFFLPDSLKIYPGHGEATTVGFEKKNNPYVL